MIKEFNEEASVRYNTFFVSSFVNTMLELIADNTITLLFQYLLGSHSAFKHEDMFVCLSLSHLEGTDEPRSEYPLVRISSSGQGLLGM